VIDTGMPDSAPTTWPNTEEMALVWINEALSALGYEARPKPEDGRPELKRSEGPH
jgi:hypothetical protein